MGVFGGLNGLFAGGSTGNIPQYVPSARVLIGHVLEVCLDSDSPLYKGSDENIGAIRFRDVFGPPTTNLGQEKGILAYPADRSNFKVPLPGEQVIIYNAYSDKITPTNHTAPGYFYANVITNTANITNNSSPFVGIAPSLLAPGARSVTFAQVEKRFDKRIKNLQMFKDSSAKPVIHKQMQPFEGDYILQGRYGNSIRFGGTPTDATADNGPEWASKKRGKPGDSIITIRLKNETIKANQVKNNLYDIEDINEDAASIYLTTTQEIGLKLAVPDKGSREHPLASWAYSYGVSAPEVLESETHMFDGEQARNADDKKTPKQTNNPTTPGDISNAGATGIPETGLTDGQGKTDSHDGSKTTTNNMGQQDNPPPGSTSTGNPTTN